METFLIILVTVGALILGIFAWRAVVLGWLTRDGPGADYGVGDDRPHHDSGEDDPGGDGGGGSD
jgi:hypothetical protein